MKKMVMLVLMVLLVGCKGEKPYTLSFNDSESKIRNALYLDKGHTWTSSDFDIKEYPDFTYAFPIRKDEDYKGKITMNDKKTFTFIIKKTEEDPFYNAYPSLNTADHVFEIIDYETLLSLFDEGEHILYLGFPRCPWCVEYVYYYNLAAKELGKTIKYYDFQAIRVLVDQDGEKVLHSDFQRLVDKIDSKYLKEREVEGITYPWIYAPTIYIIKNGEVVDFLSGGVVGHVAREGGLTKEQKETFLENLKALFSK